MAGKRQQYELLDHSVDQQHDQAGSSNLPSHLSRPTKNVASQGGFSNHVAEALQPGKITFLWIILSHLVVTGILVGTIVLGATKRTYAINEQAQFLGMTLSVDNQMFFYGLFNKVADYVLNDSIGRISGTLLTVWMSGTTRFPGVLPIDFELPEEMSKPWRSVLNNIRRWKLDHPKNKSASIFRILATFASGWTVLLLGGSFNVVAMPKLRWAGRSVTGLVTSVGIYAEAPITRIDNVNWSNLDGVYTGIFGTEVASDSHTSIGDALAAASSLELLTDLVYAINIGSRKRNDLNPRSPGFVNLYTIQRARAVQYGVDFREPPLAVRGRGFTNANLTTEATLASLSVQEGPIYDFWTNGNHSSYAAKGLGVRNWFNLTLPTLSTTCIDTANTATQGAASVVSQTNSSTITVNVPGNGTVSGMYCTILVQQAVFPIYIYNSTQDARDELNTPLNNRDTDLKYLTLAPQNAAIASSLAAKLNATIPHLEQATDISFSNLLTSLSAQLSKTANSTYIVSSNAAMNYVVGSLAQHLLTVAVWEESDTDQRHSVGPIQYQLYGSGPRQDWQWAIAMVLGLAIIVLAYDAFLLGYKRMKPGPWLSVPGMMIAANSASSLRDREDGDDGAWKIGEVTEDIERTKYCLAPGSDGLVEISRLDARKRRSYVVVQ